MINPFRRPIVILISILSPLALSMGASGQTPESPPRGQVPNIILILADDLGWKDVGYNGAQFYETPNIDRLARNGMIFTNAYSSGPNCAPTRACLISGMYTPRHLVYTPAARSKGDPRKMKLWVPVQKGYWQSARLPQPAEDPFPVRRDLKDFNLDSIAEILNTGGYRTARFGKWQLGDKNFQGFHVSSDVDRGPKAAGSADTLTDLSVDFMQDNRNRPFFLYLSHHEVHEPYIASSRLVNKYRNKKKSWTAENNDYDPIYAGMVESLDNSVGRITTTLEKLKISDNTLILFTSDNGAARVTPNAPLRNFKGSLYEGGIRVPACVQWPATIAAGSVSDTPITTVDFLPTFANLAKTPLPAGQAVDGESLVPLLKGESALTDRAIFWHFPLYLKEKSSPASAIRKGDWKLIEYFEDQSLELYNLSDDIGESQNRATSMPEKAKALHDELVAWRKRTKAVVPVLRNPYYQGSADSPEQLGRRLRLVQTGIQSLQDSVRLLEGNKARLKGLVDELQVVAGDEKVYQIMEDGLLGLGPGAKPSTNVVPTPHTTSAAPPNSRNLQPPNLVFIMVDDLGWADLGAYGSKAILTPNLDRMAAMGMRFTDAYAGHTICAPSRWALMLGQHTGHTRVRINTNRPLEASDVTMAEVLRQAGYATGGFGKWGIGGIGSTGAPEKQGFDTFFGYYHHVHAHSHYPPFLIENGRLFPLTGNAKIYGLKSSEFATTKSAYSSYKKMSPVGPFVPRRTEQGEYQFAPELVFDRTKEFIRQNRDRRFFCYAPWTPPHADYHIPENEPAVRIYGNKPWSNAAKVHAAFVSMVDRQVGELLQLLRELGIAESTAVFFMSDNGPSNRHDGTLDSAGALRGAKRSMHDGGIRSPLLAYWPGRFPAGVVSDHITYSPDMLPTLAELAGAESFVPNNVDGLSLVPTLLGDSANQNRHQFLYWEGEDQRAARQGRWKLVSKKPDIWQVFDLKNDISESKNVARDQTALITELKQWLQANRTPG